MHIYILYLEGFKDAVQVTAAKFDTVGEQEIFVDDKGKVAFIVYSSKVVAIDFMLVPEDARPQGM